MVSDGADPADRGGRRSATEPRLISLPAAARAPTPPAMWPSARRAGELIAFIDDDIDAPEGWLEALLAGAGEAPDHDVFGGPIRARLEGGGPRACGREKAPITTLDFGRRGPRRRPRLERQHGRPPARVRTRGDCSTKRSPAAATRRSGSAATPPAAGRVRYLAARRPRPPPHRATTRPSRSLVARRLPPRPDRAAQRRAQGPARPGSTRSCARSSGCAWHIVRRRCAIGIVLLAHAAGPAARGARGAHADDRDDGSATTSCRARAATSPGSGPPRGRSPRTSPPTRSRGRRCAPAGCGRPPRARRGGGCWRSGSSDPSRTCSGPPARSSSAPTTSSSSRARRSATRGKFENLNALLAEHPAAGPRLAARRRRRRRAATRASSTRSSSSPSGSTLRLAQPAHRARSHAAWDVTRRRRGDASRARRDSSRSAR